MPIVAKQRDQRSCAALRRRGGRFPLALLLGLTIFPGCGGDDATLLGSYLSELEFGAPLESSITLPLGAFDIPTPAVTKVAGATRTVWVRISFELVAEILPENEAAVTSSLAERRGAIHDAVLTIVRTSSTDELTDPRSSALRMRITEAVRPLLGDDKVRQFILYNHNAEKI
jgi:hypothetical protein